MRRLIAVALVVAGVSLPLCAQRGGARGGGGGGAGFSARGGGFASHSAPAFRGSFPSAGRATFMGAPQFSASRYAAATPTPRMTGRVAAPTVAIARNGARPGYGGDYRYRRPYLPFYGLGVGVGVTYGVGWLGNDCPGFADCGFYGDSGYGYGDSEYAPQGPLPDYPTGTYDVQPVGPPVEQAEAMPSGAFRPVYERPPAEPQAEDAVTLVFKDGRPAQQIHNYMLTRTTLYVQDERHREIPVEQLDLAATVKANREAGVNFQLPASAR